MTKDDILKMMQDAGLLNPRVIAHMAAGRAMCLDLYCGPDSQRIKERIAQRAGKTDVSAAIMRLKG